MIIALVVLQFIALVVLLLLVLSQYNAGSKVGSWGSSAQETSRPSIPKMSPLGKIIVVLAAFFFINSLLITFFVQRDTSTLLEGIEEIQVPADTLPFETMDTLIEPNVNETEDVLPQ